MVTTERLATMLALERQEVDKVARLVRTLPADVEHRVVPFVGIGSHGG